MELFENIRLKIAKIMLAKKMAGTKRQLNYSNFRLVKKIGIVWDASNIKEFSCLSGFYQKMQERNIEVKILGFFPGKNLPDQFTAVRYLTCIRRNEINLLYQPVSSETSAFISSRFDIIIDINFKKLFPLQYISSLSNAAFKVGLFEPSETPDTPFDLMIELKNPVDVDNYLKQIIQYLEMINSGAEKTTNKKIS
jgi:hypothetical protein